jgi:flavodoxin
VRNTERIAKSLQSVTGGDLVETPESKINAWAQSVKALL